MQTGILSYFQASQFPRIFFHPMKGGPHAD